MDATQQVDLMNQIVSGLVIVISGIILIPIMFKNIKDKRRNQNETR